MSTAEPGTEHQPQPARLWPPYAAGFTTAFGAHGVAANLRRYPFGPCR